ncbi:MAG: sulfatase-like hydrolase/transferase [Planctomycetes bacterium]|nr:sulfatase-like hydrolase/transferase [Planctomycetota bacterium]
MNVILLVVDTLRYDHLGCNGNDWIRTPNLDRFAAEATVFDNSYTGSYPTIPHRTDVISGQYGAPFHEWLPLRFDKLALPQVLANAGYATQLICDTPHLINGGHNFDYPFHAWHLVRGNEVDRHWIDDRMSDLGPTQREQYVRANGTFFPTVLQYIRNNRTRRNEEEWPSPMLFSTVCRWLEDNKRRTNFFLWIDSFDPHEPWDPPEHYIEMYAKDFREKGDLGVLFGWETHQKKEISPDQLQRMCAHYAGECTMVDTWFGTMLDTLDRLDLTKNTAIIVTTDHGTNLGAHDQIHKGYPLWDQVAHSLMMVRVPGQKGSVRRLEMIQPQDVFPTVCDLLGVAIPEEVEGHSFARLLDHSEPQGWPRKVAVSGTRNALHGDKEAVLTVQDAEWCLLDSTNPANRRLYHKPTDPEEANNVAAANPKIVQTLHEKLLDELKGRGALQAHIDWFATGKKGQTPADYQPRDPYVKTFRPYFSRILGEEQL